MGVIRLIEVEGRKVREVERDLGIGSGCITHWRAEFRKEKEGGLEVFSGQGNPRDEELVRLRRENAQLRQDREILKKALGLLSGPQK